LKEGQKVREKEGREREFEIFCFCERERDSFFCVVGNFDGVILGLGALV
jgi:hypothetical protein